MGKRWIFWVVVPALVLVGGFAGFFVVDSDNGTGWQMAQMAAPPGQQEKKPPAAAPSAPSAAAQPAPSAAAPPAPSAGAAAPKTAPGPGWALNCKSEPKEKALDCRLSQTVVTQQGQMLANATFLIPAAPGKPEMNIQLPLGVLLTDAVNIRVDQSTPQKLNFRACDRGGCYAQGPISPDFMALLRKGKELNIAFKDLADNAITVPMSLEGFPEAYGKIPSS